MDKTIIPILIGEADIEKVLPDWLRGIAYLDARRRPMEDVAYDAALKLASDDVEVRNNKGNALQRLGVLQATQSQYPQAATSYRQAIAAFDTALRRAPDYGYAHNNKDNALQGLGELQAELQEVTQAAHSLRAATAEWSRLFEIAPGDQRVREWRDQAQALLDNLEQ